MILAGTKITSCTGPVLELPQIQDFHWQFAEATGVREVLPHFFHK